MIWLALGAAFGVAVIWCGVAMAYTARQAFKARDAALRAGIAVVVARQSAKAAEDAVGLVAWPERKV